MSKNIILIDDNPTENIINEYLIRGANSNANISIIDNSNEAITSLTQTLFDLENQQKHLVVIDQKMPGMSGLEIVEELEELIDLDPGKVIIYLLTNDNSVRLQEKSKIIGSIKAILQKPLTPEMAAEILRSA
tara:strand:+ start:66679 stop:67074 length:396 start_codon:yes stop_codon:yes gene_type:complete